MTDAITDPFAEFDPDHASFAGTKTAAPETSDPFAEFDPDHPSYKPPKPQAETSAAGALATHAALGAAPAVGALVGAGAGAEAGGIGGALVAGPIGGVVGGIAGGLVGAFGGGYAVGKAQDYAIDLLPDSWKDPIRETAAAQEEQYPTASFIGGLLPIAATMDVRSLPAALRAELPPNATRMQQILADPQTARMFSGAIFGGQELATEALSDNPISWTNVGLATSFGLVFSRPNAIGEKIIGAGSRAAGRLGSEIRARVSPADDTVNEANDLGIFSPESVSSGQEEAAPGLGRAAADARSSELGLLEPPPEPDIHAFAREVDPYLFDKRDELDARETDLRGQIERVRSPADEDLRAAEERVADAQAEYQKRVDDQGGYSGGKDARRLRANLRGMERELEALQTRRNNTTVEGAEPSPEETALRQELDAVRREQFDIQPHLYNAYRQAAERAHAETVPHEVSEPVAPPVPGEGFTGVPEAPKPAPDTILNDVRAKLMDAGRPPEEADAAARLEAAYYTTLAQDFKTTPEDLYAREQADIKANPDRRGGGSFTYDDGKRTVTLFRHADASSVIHEKGHEYLERMIRFAARDDAPQDFKDRADAALKWMDLKNADDLDPKLTGKGKARSTRAQEKFARGFEQYMREGIAPSKELAGVFERFSQWLKTIYQTIKGLGAPINDDIRRVFDRMLASEPGATVIAPEPSSLPKTLADLHAIDLAHTEPGDAHAAGDRVVAEVSRAVQDLPPEIVHELEAAHEALHPETSVPAGEAAGDTEPGGPVAGGGPLARIVAPSEAGGEQSGAVAGGGERPVPKGAGLPASGGGERGSGPDAGPFAPRPAAVIDTVRSTAVDKLGNIRPENLTSHADLVEAMRAVVERNPESVQPGRVTMGEMRDAANAIGVNLKDIDEPRLAEMFGGYDKIRVGLWALRNAIIDQAKIVGDAMGIAAKSGLDEDLLRMGEEMDKHGMMMATLSKVQAESARTLGMSFRNLEEWKNAKSLAEYAKENTSRTLYQLKQIAKMGAQLDSPAKIGRFLKSAKERSFGRMILEYWINGLISGPATHATYAVGNELLALHNAVFETGTAAVIGKVRAAFGREGERIRFGEVGAKLGAHITEMPKAIQAGNEALRSGLATHLPGEEGRATTPFHGDLGITVAKEIGNEHVTWGDAMRDTFAMSRGLKDGLVSWAALIRAGGDPSAPALGLSYSPLGQIPDIQIKGVTALPLGTVLRAPGRAIAGIHSYFRTTGYSMDIAAQAYRIASGEGRTGAEFSERVGALRQSPSPEMMESARSNATNMTLMGQGGEFVKSISRLVNTEFSVPGVGKVPLLKFIDPFVHIASNVIDQSIVKRSPVGLLSPEMRATLGGKHGNAAADMAAARMLVGTGLAVTTGILAAQGYVSGSGPTDATDRARWMADGTMAHSVRIGDMWYDIHRLGPLGMLLGISADLYDVAHLAQDDEYQEAAAHLQHAFTQNILDESFMRGPADLIKAIEEPDRYGTAYIRNFMSSLTPFSVGMAQIARASDLYARDARTVVDAIKAKTPGLSQEVHPRIDIWGQPVPSREAFGAPGVSAIWTSKVNNDPVVKALQAAEVYPAKPKRSLNNVDLDEDQYEYFQRAAGQLLKANLDRIVPTEHFRSMSIPGQRVLVGNIIEQTRTVGKVMTLAHYPELAKEARDAMVARKTGNW